MLTAFTKYQTKRKEMCALKSSPIHCYQIVNNTHMLHFVHIQTEQTQPRKNMYLLFWREISTPSLFCDMNMMGVYIKYCIFFTFQHS